MLDRVIDHTRAFLINRVLYISSLESLEAQQHVCNERLLSCTPLIMGP